MSNFVVGNIFLVLSIFAASIGNVLIKAIISDLPTDLSGMQLLKVILLSDRIWRASLAGVLVVAGFLFWLFCLQKLPLSYAYPIACSATLVVALFSVLFLGEVLSWRLWAGTLLIALGTALVVSQQ
jgi:drug/metabolite transporter (DMT)-like permease